MKIKHAILTLCAMAAIAASLASLWWAAAEYLRARLPSFLDERVAEGIVLNPRAVTVDGFPFSFRLTWGGKMDTPLFSMDTTRMTVARPVTWPERYAIEWPEGFVLYTPHFLTARETVIDIELPKGFPANITRNAVAQWQARDGEIRIPHFDMRLGDRSGVRGDALAFLDANLQPQAIARLKITEPLSVLDLFKDLIPDEKTTAIVAGLIRGMSRPDPETGVPVLDIELRVNGGRLFVGPLQVAFVPNVDWPDDPLPAPGQ